MYEPIETIIETVGLDEQVRLRYSMDAFTVREQRSPLRGLYEYWKALPVGAHGLPNVANCQPKLELPPKIAHFVSWIDTTAQDPMKYIIREHIEKSARVLGVDLSDTMICDRPELLMHTSACAVEYMFCKHERTPMYHEIEQHLCGKFRHYTRVMLPVEDDDGSVNRIYYAVRDVRSNRHAKLELVGDA